MDMPENGPQPSPDMPPSLATRPRDPRRGLPIPPVNLHPDPSTGAPMLDFTTVNTTTATSLAIDRRCSLCGELMGYWVGFLGSPRAAELMQYADPPGCPDCLKAAITLCPHIAMQRHRRARTDRPGAGILPPGADPDKPPSWVLGITRSYRPVFVAEHGYTVYLPAPFRTVHTFGYGPDGRINPVPITRQR
jgi:hypothetical protein